MSRRARPRTPARKLRQLCRQVERALSRALDACADPDLHSLAVVQVRPAPDSRRLSVELRLTAGVEAAEVTRIGGRLEAAGARLRAEVACAINRRKAPSLVFQIQI